MENITFVNNFVNSSLNISKFCMSINIVDIEKAHKFGCYGNILVGYYEFLSYQNVCIYKMAWHSVNTVPRVLNHISLERAVHQHSDKVCGV